MTLGRNPIHFGRQLTQLLVLPVATTLIRRSEHLEKGMVAVQGVGAEGG